MGKVKYIGTLDASVCVGAVAFYTVFSMATVGTECCGIVEPMFVDGLWRFYRNDFHISTFYQWLTFSTSTIDVAIKVSAAAT